MQINGQVEYDSFGNVVTKKFFVILNLERMNKEDRKPVFWKADGVGYTDNILLAGIYSEAELKMQCICADDPVVPVHKLPKILTCDLDALKEFEK